MTFVLKICAYGSPASFLLWMAGSHGASKVSRLCPAVLGGVLTGAVVRQFGTIGLVFSYSATLLFCHYCYSKERSRIVFCPSERLPKDNERRHLSESIENILSRNIELSNPKYIPTLWAGDTWMNLVLFMIKQIIQKKWLKPVNLSRRELLVLSDAGTVSIDFGNDDHLPPDAPVVLFLHTVTGSSFDTSSWMEYATSRGWRSCVLNRRGHGMVRLTSPSFNVMGDYRDTVEQVDFVVKKFPQRSFLGMVGISAGSGLLINYLGKEGVKTPVEAACSICPAYDISNAFKLLAERYPLVDQFLLKSMKKVFLFRNMELLSSWKGSGLSECLSCQNCHQFILTHHPFTGCDSSDQFFKEHNPMEHVEGVRRPTMVLNSEDDIVCLKENIRDDVVGSLPGGLLIRTPRGSHIAYNEGILGTGNYMHRITFEFLDTAKQVLEEKTC